MKRILLLFILLLTFCLAGCVIFKGTESSPSFPPQETYKKNYGTKTYRLTHFIIEEKVVNEKKETYLTMKTDKDNIFTLQIYALNGVYNNESPKNLSLLMHLLKTETCFFEQANSFDADNHSSYPAGIIEYNNPKDQTYHFSFYEEPFFDEKVDDTHELRLQCHDFLAQNTHLLPFDLTHIKFHEEYSTTNDWVPLYQKMSFKTRSFFLLDFYNLKLLGSKFIDILILSIFFIIVSFIYLSSIVRDFFT